MITGRPGWGLWVCIWVLAAACRGPAAAASPTPADTPVPTITVLAATTQAPLAATATRAPEPTALPATPTEPPPEPTQPAPTATTPPGSPTPEPAVLAILNYLEARAAADVEQAQALVCQAFKGQAATEAISFRAMNARLEDVSCSVNGRANGFSQVQCGGKIITTYGAETREWDLSTFIYQAAEEDGQWKMCGYQ